MYESKNYHNVVFVGMDRGGKSRYTALRRSGTDFIGDANGKNYSFSIPAEGNSKVVHLFESAIDLLSYATLRKMDGHDWRAEHLLSLAGVYQTAKEMERSKVLAALTRFLKEYPEAGGARAAGGKGPALSGLGDADDGGADRTGAAGGGQEAVRLHGGLLLPRGGASPVGADGLARLHPPESGDKGDAGDDRHEKGVEKGPDKVDNRLCVHERVPPSVFCVPPRDVRAARTAPRPSPAFTAEAAAARAA